MEAIIKLAVLVIGFFAFIYAVSRDDYEECDGSECDLCPFPCCENAPKDLSKAQMRRMNGQTVAIVMKDSVFPVKISVENGEVWVTNPFGSSTTYDDVKNHGGKFFEKNYD